MVNFSVIFIGAVGDTNLYGMRKLAMAPNAHLMLSLSLKCWLPQAFRSFFFFFFTYEEISVEAQSKKCDLVTLKSVLLMIYGH